MVPTIKIGIIGGTGLDQDATILQDRNVVPVPETPFGKPSDPEVIHGTIHGIEVYILGRHGRNHDVSPTNVNYRANLWTLKQLGVTHILATTACGSLKESMAPGHLAVIDQYIDRTNIRGGRSFYKVAHIPQPKPFEPKLQTVLFESAKEAGYSVHPTVTAVAIEGPRFSTLAESRLYQSWGADLVNMTLVPEVQLASELGFVYASLALVTDYDCWHSDELSVSVEFVTKMLQSLSTKAKDVLVRAVEKIANTDWSEIIEQRQNAAKNAIMVE
ncbi:hypothetical protein RDWZM_003099 [Blomia tropicalis]|uniref:S-methyl-5'-thioadenosine phosphorylase n=1 Tax=Blomia tropicalis TaxID=40697 RepID=A0A9Q0MFF7_BLOTA|nr:hypothetical protein BLOT_000858 [Blomia tropicalis]KAJ6224554.1 hypothetical protein RDWZM_003099 [Blomia tropicalis]